MRKLLVTWYTDRRFRKKVLEWIRDEQNLYADQRNQGQVAEVLEKMKDEGVGRGSWWFLVALGYLDRAEKLGLENPAGRQAVMKATATMIDLAANMIQAYGLPPLPGYPSGEIHFSGDGCAENHGRRVISTKQESA
jgi:hypothetical protein